MSLFHPDQPDSFYVQSTSDERRGALGLNPSFAGIRKALPYVVIGVPASVLTFSTLGFSFTKINEVGLTGSDAEVMSDAASGWDAVATPALVVLGLILAGYFPARVSRRRARRFE